MAQMTSREKAYWLSEVMPYRSKYMQGAFREGARAFWSGRTPETYLMGQQEKAAFWKGYNAAQDKDAEQ